DNERVTPGVAPIGEPFPAAGDFFDIGTVRASAPLRDRHVSEGAMVRHRTGEHRDKSDRLTERRWTEMADRSPDDCDWPDAKTGQTGGGSVRHDQIRQRAYQIWEESGRPE